ncbi:MAG: hypothetical protein ACJ77N_06885 [Chloroflexota bacterium]|jgi:hypothetical protein
MTENQDPTEQVDAVPGTTGDDAPTTESEDVEGHVLHRPLGGGSTTEDGGQSGRTSTTEDEDDVEGHVLHRPL